MKHWLAGILVLLAVAVASAQEIEQSLPKLAKAWLEPGWSTEAVKAPVDALRAAIQSDQVLAEAARDFVTTAEQTRTHSGLELAALYDLIGDDEAAVKHYASAVRSRRTTPPHAARLHLIRLLRQQHPEWETQAFDARRVTSSDRYFENRIAKLESLLVFLDRELAAGKRAPAGVDPMLIEAAYGNGDYGSFYLPPLWMPELPPEHGASPPTEALALREATFEKFCHRLLAFPDHAAWAFSRLAGLAEVRGEFLDNPQLVELAKRAIAVAGTPTPFGGIEGPNRSSTYRRQVTLRLVSPELYLAHHLWKSGADEASAAGFGIGVSDRFALFRCAPAEFTDLLRATLGDDPTGRAVEAVHLWAMRGHDADLFDYLLEQEIRFAEERQDFRGNPQRTWIDYLDTVARVQRPARVRDALEQLAYVYLGRPEERSSALESLRQRTPQRARLPLARKYGELVRAMGDYPALVFPAHSVAESLGIDDFTNPSRWIDEDDLEATPDRVIDKLKLSPFLEPLARLRLIEAAEDDFIRASIGARQPKPTVFGRLAQSIAHLPEEGRKPYIDFLAGRDSFGADLLLAAIAADDDEGVSVAALLFENLDAIQGREDPAFQRELAVFASTHLPSDGEHSVAIRTALAGGLEQANRERIERLLLECTRNPEVTGRNGSILPLIIRDDPALGVDAMRRLLAMRDASTMDAAKVTAPEQGAILTRRHAGWANTLMRYAGRDLEGTPEDHRRFVEFYLGVLNDEELSRRVTINDDWLTPPFRGPDSDDERRRYFERTLKVVADHLPEWAPAEWLFFPALSTVGWLFPRDSDPVVDDAYFETFVEQFSEAHRKAVEAGIYFGRLRLDRYREDAPGYDDDPQLAAAFADIGRRIGDERLPPNLRLELARSMIASGGPLVPDTLRNESVELLARFWKTPLLVSRGAAEVILEDFIYAPADAAWQDAAAQLLAAWRSRIEATDEALGEPVEIYSDTPVLLVAVAATLGDDEMLDWLLDARWEEHLAEEPILPLTLLIRAGQYERAHEVRRKYRDDIRANYASGGVETDGAGHVTLPWQFVGRYDRELHEKLPAFLEGIESPEEKAITWMFTNAPAVNGRDATLPDRVTRYTEIARLCLEIDLRTDPVGTGPMFRYLARDPEAAGVLADDLVDAVAIDRLDETLLAEDDHGWSIHGEAMITALVTAGRSEQAREVLEKIAAKTRTDLKGYGMVWKDLSGGVYRCASNLNSDADALAELLPLTRFLARLSADLDLPETSLSLVAENYARNIVWHALADRMEEWRRWHADLPATSRASLEQFWYPRSNRIFDITRFNVSSRDVEKRLRVTRRMLSVPEIVGDSGPLHDQLAATLMRNNFFDKAELLEHGEAIAEVVPDAELFREAIEALREGEE